jgi:hypothetical protein
MATWKVRTHHKKSCEQIEYFYNEKYDGHIIVRDGFRFCEYEVYTSDDNLPEFEFTEVPGGDGKKDSIDLNNCCVNNIEDAFLYEMFDGGCWGGVDFPEDMDEEEQERLQEFIDENGSYALEDEEDWSLSETEVWVWGPLEIVDEAGEIVRIICADDNGNVIDFVEE